MKNKRKVVVHGGKLRLYLMRFFAFLGTAFETLGPWFLTITIISCIAEIIVRSDRFSSSDFTGVFACSGLAFMVLMFAVYSLFEHLWLVRKISKMNEDELDKTSLTLGYTVLTVILIALIVIGVMYGFDRRL